MIDLTNYDNEGKKEIFINEDEEIVSKKEDSNSNVSNGIIEQAEEVEMSNEEDGEEEDNPAKDLNEYMVEGDEDIGDLLAQDVDDNTKIDKVNELLFCCQGIGKFVTQENKKMIYEKNEYCIPSLKDIHRFLRNDNKETQIFKRAILNWKIVESDLIPCLREYEDDEKISQMITVILADLTEDLNECVEGRKELEFSLSKLNETLIKEGIVDYISRKLNSSTEEYSRARTLKEKYKQLEIEEKKKREQEKELKKNEEKKNEIENGEKKDNGNIGENKEIILENGGKIEEIKDKNENNVINIDEEKSEEDNEENKKEQESQGEENKEIEEEKENEEINQKIDKRLDTTKETKQILLRQIAQME